MKYALGLLASLIFMCSCSNVELETKAQRLQTEKDSIITVCNAQEQLITTLRDSISILKYPSSDRLAQARRLLSEGNLDQAENELNELQRVFPNSQEAQSIPSLRNDISNERERIRLERERIEALGFKAITQKSTVVVDYNTCTLSQFSTGTQFTFDAYGDRWFYRTADRGNKYVTMAMSVRSSSHSPRLPEFAVYKISGSNMRLVSRFKTEYARWSDYGSYLGNYSDNRNNFAKVSTVQFKLGAEVPESVTSGAYAIVMYNSNVLIENYDRFKNPPQYWTGNAPFTNTLTVDSFASNYVLIKTFNLR